MNSHDASELGTDYGHDQDLRGERLLICLATYNEAGNIASLIEQIKLFAPHADLLVIDDNSPDGTAKIVSEIAAGPNKITLLQRHGKLGLGSAVLEGIRHAIAHEYELFVNLDADFSHPPRYIPSLLAGMADADVTIGSRYVPGGGISGGFGPVRRFMSWGVNIYTRLLLGMKTQDNSGSYRCYRVSYLGRLNLDRVRSKGYAFFEELIYLCRRAGCRIGETPILFEPRRSGQSNLNANEILKALGVIALLGWERLTRPPAAIRRDPRTSTASVNARDDRSGTNTSVQPPV